MKKIILLTILTITSICVHARKCVWDVRIGLGMSQLLYDDNKDFGSMFAYKAAVDFTLPISFKCFFFFPLEYTKKGGNMKEINKKLLETTNLQTGFQFGYNIRIKHPNLKLRMGPYVSMLVGEQQQGEDFLNTNGHEYIITEKIEAGITVGADLEYKHYVVGVEYQRGIFNSATMNYDNKAITNSALYMTLGYRF